MNKAKLEIRKKQIKSQMDDYWFAYTPLHEMDISKMTGRQMAEEIRMWRRSNLFDEGKELGAILSLLNNFYNKQGKS